ncbi:sulfatase family protein [Maribellus maritimus]|uniref:sulfatase family protein n=1 Tax=Maribellus maritimus TaxID=2870838 RepID=UPI001EEA7927|nr:sulfatase-like hydrolase/transferase [Maribellus maritimus]MCG6191241.1 sulfatase-like hydrolase/transferase [Maribellus maritimus]
MRKLIYLIAILFFITGGVFASLTGKTNNKPNIILVMADDLGWGDVGFNGNKIIKTPGLDKLASSGVILDRFYSAAPVCSPTRGSFLTGRHPYRYGIYFANAGFMKEQEITLAEELQKQGYTTGHFGKWHLGAISNSIPDGRRGGSGTKFLSTPWDNGFDVCFSTEQAVPTWNPMENQSIKTPTRYWTGPGVYETENLEGDDSRVIMDRALPFIQNAAKNDKPFFMVIWFHTPHSPVVAGPKYLDMYNEYDENKQHYYGCITAMDEQISRLHNELKKLGIDKNTLITFCSDNGPAGEGGGICQYPGKRQQGSSGGFRGRKGSLYEGGVRVSAFVVWPGHLETNKRTSYPGVTSDYFPTILGILGIGVPQNRPYDGIDLIKALKTNDKKRNGFIGFQSRKQKSLISQQYKLISVDGEKFELYDLIQDKYEKNNIAESHPEKVTEMKQQLEEWIKSCENSDEGHDYY